MSTGARLAVTGATGALGGLISAQLARDGVAQRLLVRDPAAAPDLPAANVRRCSYDDAEAAAVALDGVHTLFMVSAAENQDRLGQHRTFVDAAARAQVAHIVYTSFAGAAPDATFTLARDHFETEEHIKKSGVAYTFLRNNFYMDVMPAFTGLDGVIRGPAGNGRAALVARADIARVAVAVLTDPGRHRGRTYDLTGPEAITLTEVAHVLSSVGSGQVRFHDETIEEAYASRQQWPAPRWQQDAWVSTYTAIAAGELAAVSGDVQALTGVAPMSFEEFARTLR